MVFSVNSDSCNSYIRLEAIHNADNNHHPHHAGDNRLQHSNMRTLPPSPQLKILKTNTTQCTLLQKSLGSQLTFPNQSPYNHTQSTYWALQESSLHPSCILLPSSPSSLSQTLSLLSSTQSCSLAIKGRGHNPAPGFANIEGGVTIDMTPLSTIEISDDHSIARVGAGASWLDVYQFLNPLNVSVAGGRNGGVGVGGLLVGGGIAHFAPRVGWACDGVVNFEVS